MPTCSHCQMNVNVPCTSLEEAGNCAVLTDTYRANLRHHDWEYEFAAHAQWRKGVQERKTLQSMQRLVDKDYAIWNQYAPEHYRR